jgi:hypothetical protein
LKLSVGRIVHYTPVGGEDNECMAAVVTFVGHQGAPALTVFYPPLVSQVHPDDLAAMPERQGDAPRGHTWHWPERVDG